MRSTAAAASVAGSMALDRPENERLGGPRSRRSTAFEVAFVACALAVFVTLSWLGGRSDSQTVDEAVHVASGYAFAHTLDPRINPDHPPLLKVLFAAPLTGLGLQDPTTNPYWESASMWRYGKSFLYANSAPADVILARSRLVSLVFGCALLLLVYAWSRELYGTGGARLSLALAAVEPNLIAHSHLATFDVALAFGIALSVASFSALLRSPSVRAWGALAVAVAFTLAVKVPGLQVLGILGVIAVVDAVREVARTRGEVAGGAAPVRQLVSLIAVRAVLVTAAAVVGLVVIWGTYGLGSPAGLVASLRNMLRTASNGHPGYLFGEVRTHGWLSYFAVALAVKLPLAVWACLLAAGLGRPERSAERRRGEIALGGMALLVIGVATLAGVNVGVRYVLAAAIAILVGCGRLMLASRWPLAVRRSLVAALVVTQVVATARIHPHYLAFFNVLAGGPSHGIHVLADSNLDWGQDLRNLATFLTQRGNPIIRLGYGGTADPAAYGIRSQSLAPALEVQDRSEALAPADPHELLAISTNYIAGILMSDPNAYRWLLDREPIARIGYSIYVYDIGGDADAHRRLAVLYARAGWERWAKHEASIAASSKPTVD